VKSNELDPASIRQFLISLIDLFTALLKYHFGLYSPYCRQGIVFGMVSLSGAGWTVQNKIGVRIIRRIRFVFQKVMSSCQLISEQLSVNNEKIKQLLNLVEPIAVSHQF